MGLDTRKPVFEIYEHKGALQFVHPRRLFNAIVTPFLESISKLAIGEISFFKLGLWFESCFVAQRPIYIKKLKKWNQKISFRKLYVCWLPEHI